MRPVQLLVIAGWPTLIIAAATGITRRSGGPSARRRLAGGAARAPEPAIERRRRSHPLVSTSMAALGVAVIAGPAAALALSVAWIGGLRVVGTRAERSRIGRIGREVPVLIDELQMAAVAGLTLRASIAEVGAGAHRSVVSALDHCAHRLASGAGLADAIDEFGAALGEGGRRLARVLLSAEVDGIAVAAALGALARDQRAEQRAIVEARVRRLPVLLLFPLVTCVLPAFALLSVAPIVLAGIGDALGSR